MMYLENAATLQTSGITLLGQFENLNSVSVSVSYIGKDQKGIYKRGIHDQGDFWQFLLEIAV